MKQELEQERQRLLERNEQLKEIESAINRRLEEVEKVQRYNEKVEMYCHDMGITLYQYEKQCFWADRGYENYPAPERFNPDRQIEKEKDRTIEPERER